LARKTPDILEIKGYGNDVNIILGNEAVFSDIEAELIKRLEGSNQFLAGVEIILDAGDRVLSTAECEKLKEILGSKFNLIISAVRSSSDKTRKSAEEAGWKVESPQHPQQKKVQEKAEPEKVEEVKEPLRRESDTLLHKDTLRSGQGIWHRGNIVIVGDVNPGAEVIATGDVVVMGKLRGIAHAGAEGDTRARIIALNLRPIQLRIAGYIGRSPDLDLKTDKVPEIAQVEDGNIVIHKLK